MAKNSIVTKIGDGVETQFAITFTGGYMDESHVTCRVGSEVDGTGAPVYRALTFISEGLVNVSGDPAGDGITLTFERNTPISTAINDFQNGTILGEEKLDESFEQLIKATQENRDALQDARDLSDSAFSAAGSALAASTALSDANSLVNSIPSTFATLQSNANDALALTIAASAASFAEAEARALASASASEAAQDNINASLAGLPVILDSIADLRLFDVATSGDYATISTSSATGFGPSMPLRYDANDTTSADNGVDIFVDAIDRRWKLQFYGAYYTDWLEVVDTATMATVQERVSFRGGGIVEVSNSFDLDGQLELKSNVTLRGRNADIKVTCTADTTISAMFNIASTEYNVKVCMLHLEGDDSLGTSGSAFWTAGTNVLVEDVKFTNGSIAISDLTIAFSFRPSAEYTRLVRCEFDGWNQHIYNGFGASDTHILDCTFRNWSRRSLWFVAKAAYAIRGVVMQDNLWESPRASGGTSKQPVAFQTDGIGFNSLVFFVNNRLYLGNTPYIQADPSTNTGTADAVSFHKTNNLVISGNFVYGSGEVGINVSYGSLDFSIFGNRCYSCDTTGINIGGIENNRRGHMTDNHCQDCSRDQADDHTNIGGIMVADAIDCTVANNVVLSVRTGAEAMPNGVVIWGPCTNLSGLGSNQIRGYSGKRVVIAGAGTLTVAGYNVWRGTVSAAGVLGNKTNVDSVTKTATGTYELTLDYNVPSGHTVHVACQALGAFRHGQGLVSGKTIRVRTFNASGALVDSAFEAVVTMDG